MARSAMVERQVALSSVEKMALLAVLSGRFSTSGIARVLGASTITAARTIAKLRSAGWNISTVRTADGWHYELRTRGMFRERWHASSLREMAGFIKTRQKPAGRFKPDDETLYAGL